MATVQMARTCNVCEAMCGMVATVEDGRLTQLRPDPDDVFSRGHICPKGPAMREVLEDPDRLREPVRRTPGGWEKISWDAAFDEAARGLRAVQKAHGRDAVGIYAGNPNVHNHGAMIFLPGFARSLGTHNRFDANSQDANPKLFACQMMYGDPVSVTLPDVDRTDHLLMLGANPAASNGSLMTLGDVRGRLMGIRKRGGRLVLVDPRRTETAAWADEHHFIRPGGDAPLLLGMLHVLFAERLVRDGLAESQAAPGTLSELGAAVAAYPPDRVAPAAGIAPETIRALARDFAGARTAVAYGRVGTCQNPFGPTASWLIEALNLVTGNFDRAGGAMFASPAVDLSFGRRTPGGSFARYRSRVRALPEFGGQLPAAVMAEEMETPGPGQIRALVTVAGNPVLSTANGERLGRALGGLDFMVSIDPYLNETTRHAHLVLPPVHALERSHYDLIFHSLAVHNTAKYSAPVVPPPPGALDDGAILYGLAMRMGGFREGPWLLQRALKAAWSLGGLRPSSDLILDLLLRTGPYGDRFLPWRKATGLSLARLKAAPHGVDLGPLRPCRADKIRLPGGRVALAPPVFLADLPRLDRFLTGSRRAPGDLVLIGRRHLRTNNSWMHNLHSLVKGPDRATLLVHPADAARAGLVSGDRARIESRTGAVIAPVEITADLLEGVVSLPHGYGHAPLQGLQRLAGALPGPNVNALTDDLAVEPILGTAVLNGVEVRVSPALPDAAAASG